MKSHRLWWVQFRKPRCSPFSIILFFNHIISFSKHMPVFYLLKHLIFKITLINTIYQWLYIYYTWNVYWYIIYSMWLNIYIIFTWRVLISRQNVIRYLNKNGFTKNWFLKNICIESNFTSELPSLGVKIIFFPLWQLYPFFHASPGLQSDVFFFFPFLPFFVHILLCFIIFARLGKVLMEWPFHKLSWS